MIDPETTERLIAYLDDELTSAERTDVEQLLARDEQARRFLAGMRRNDDMIAQADTIDAPEEYWDSFNERLMGRILRAEALRRSPRNARSGPRAPSRPRVRWMGALQVAATILLVATVTFQLGMQVGGMNSTQPTRLATPVDDPGYNAKTGDGRDVQQTRTWRTLNHKGAYNDNLFAVVRIKGGNWLEPIRPLNTEQLNSILVSAEDVLTPLANGRVGRPEELKAYQVILVNSNLLKKLNAARNTSWSEPRVPYVLNNTYDVLKRVASASPDTAKVVAVSLQKDVNDLGLLEATQELIRENKDLIARNRNVREAVGAKQ